MTVLDGNTTLFITGIVLLGFLAAAILLSRNTSRQKKAAIASLKEERAHVGSYDITAMANEEIEKLGLRSINGAEDLSTDVLLKTWTEAPQSTRDCSRDSLSYVVADGVDPVHATASEVRLVCTDAPSHTPPESFDADELAAPDEPLD